jgi:hypothetical protein
MDILMPGDPGFDIPAGNEQLVPFTGDLTGRFLALDVTRATKWQCGGFSVNTHTPIGVVTPQAQQMRLRQALIEGILTRYLPPAGQNTSSRARADPDIYRQAEKSWIQPPE